VVVECLTCISRKREAGLPHKTEVQTCLKPQRTSRGKLGSSVGKGKRSRHKIPLHRSRGIDVALRNSSGCSCEDEAGIINFRSSICSCVLMRWISVGVSKCVQFPPRLIGDGDARQQRPVAQPHRLGVAAGLENRVWPGACIVPCLAVAAPRAASGLGAILPMSSGASRLGI